MRFTNTQTVKQFTTSLTVGLLSATLFACGGGAGDSADTTGGNANGGTSGSGGRYRNTTVTGCIKNDG